MNPSVFKSYDIRGLAPEALDSAFARRLGKVLASLYHPTRVVVGRDMRPTSEALESALIEGFTASGVTVTRIGLCTTPMFNFALGSSNGAYDLGVMVTASHNPSEYNGFKMETGDVISIGFGNGMEAVRDAMCSDASYPDATEAGTVEEDADMLPRYLKHVIDLVPLPTPLPAWRIAVDAGNGMEGHVLPKFTKKLAGMEFVQLFWDVDGTFPNHDANPSKPETLAALKASILKDQCAFGIAFDGDADRVSFVDEKGEQIPGDILLSLLAGELLRVHGAGTILYDVRSSWAVPETIRARGGEPVMCRVGHAHIRKQMKELDALFGGECSMHFYFRDEWNCESGELATLLILQMLLREQQPLSALWKPLQRYVHPDEMNMTVMDPQATIQAVKDAYAADATSVIELDGIRCEFRDPAHPEEDWWFNLRASNTEPVIRLNYEARTAEQAERRKQELVASIQQATDRPERASPSP